MRFMSLDNEDDINISGLQQEKESEGLLRKQNVVGMGIGRKYSEHTGERRDEPCLTVLVTQKMHTDDLTEGDRIPEAVGRYKTDVLTVGHLFAGGGTEQIHVRGKTNGKRAAPATPQFKALLPSLDIPPVVLDMEPAPPVGVEVLTRRIRPAQGGFSVAHPRVTAGTIATGVVDAGALPGVPARYFLLSNNHVLANSNAANLGDPILQPGPADGGTFPADVIGRLARFVPIRFDGTDNLVDAAIAEVAFEDINREIYWIGYPAKSITTVQVGQTVQKTGRTTNYTQGQVQVINATVNINYGGGRVARFVRQIVTTAMSAGGDSGSLVLNVDDQPVGLLFAGSNVSTILNPIALVQSSLGIRIGL